MVCLVPSWSVAEQCILEGITGAGRHGVHVMKMIRGLGCQEAELADPGAKFQPFNQCGMFRDLRVANRTTSVAYVQMKRSVVNKKPATRIRGSQTSRHRDGRTLLFMQPMMTSCQLNDIGSQPAC